MKKNQSCKSIKDCKNCNKKNVSNKSNEIKNETKSFELDENNEHSFELR